MIFKNPKKLFLIDAAGAFLSSFLLGVVLRRFESNFGMPRDILLFLALLPILFAAYDYYAYFGVKTNWQTHLKGIAIINLMYCGLTTGLVIYYYEQLTFLGVTYFVVEILVIVILVLLEFKASSKNT